MTGQVRTVDGRVAGRRGQATRQKLLECLREMLDTSPYRDVKVIDVARMAGTSPATFYQYFQDVESAILEIANDMAKDGQRLKTLTENQAWAGKGGYAAAEALVDGFLEFWQEYEPILRVVDLAAAEGDKRFYKVRQSILTAVTHGLTEAIEDVHAKHRTGDEVVPNAMAGTLVAMLAAVSGHQKGFETWKIKMRDVRPALATLVYMGITGKKPPR
ncbi:TetR/AcrR family transcriptional regulator [Yinghuangia sp. ASG 101]|uniref:TetR/AcrR family transcriptional regulator n=1 Tax=Yinghuangia sp. ASG 101 TaxID=2896848 RepID=UPI001E2FC70F|nr:TetR/AcrR family transcriptional regulator [Yinghuangia sp. ASG 101]UGQ09270.1 TetR/AcrR family transcriptional regulator [Yinghuangia sp. ASG 101]